MSIRTRFEMPLFGSKPFPANYHNGGGHLFLLTAIPNQEMRYSGYKEPVSYGRAGHTFPDSAEASPMAPKRHDGTRRRVSGRS